MRQHTDKAQYIFSSRKSQTDEIRSDAEKGFEHGEEKLGRKNYSTELMPYAVGFVQIFFDDVFFLFVFVE